MGHPTFWLCTIKIMKAKLLLLATLFCLCNSSLAQTVTAVSAGFDHTLFLKSDGSLWAMGANGSGQLGDGTTNNRYVPMLIVPSNVVAVAAGHFHSLYLKSDGNLWAMGANGNGQLGDGTTSEQHTPEQITFTGGVTAIAAGGAHSLFLKANALWGMGANGDGELGNGNNSDVHSPVQLKSSGVYQISAGGQHSLYVTTDGSLWGMGYNNFGALGDGTMATRYSPIEILTNHSVFSGVYAIAAGVFHSLYLFQSPGSIVSVWGMGDNLTGDLGDNSASPRYSPVETVTSGGSAIAAGYGFSLLRKSNSSLWATGTDLAGQLGDGNSGQFAVSVVWEQIVSSNVTAIAAGGAHSLFIKSDGSLWGMGANNFGQLGDGTTNNVSLPERIFPPMQLVVTNLAVSAGTNLIFRGLNEFFGGTTYVWSSTNLALPFNQWTRTWTNGIGSGNFSFTANNLVSPGTAGRFYRLELLQIQ
jgi:alpha-tubulin suppressor-like RCC1 family protein